MSQMGCVSCGCCGTVCPFYQPPPPRPVSTPLVNIALTFHHLFVQRAPDTPARGPRRLPPPPGSQLPRVTPRGQEAGSSSPRAGSAPPSFPRPYTPVPSPAANSSSSCAPKPPSHPLWPGVPGAGSGCVQVLGEVALLPSPGRHPALWPVVALPLTQPPLSQVPRPPPVPLLSAGDELLRQLSDSQNAEPATRTWGWALLERPPPTPSPQRGVGWRGGKKRGGWITAYPSLSPFPSRFHFHTYNHPPGTGGGWCSLNAGNWLSLWSPVYFPAPLRPPSSSPPPPHAASRPGAAGKPAGKHCSHETSLDPPSCGLGLPCRALPCLALTWVHLGHLVLERKAFGAPHPGMWKR